MNLLYRILRNIVLLGSDIRQLTKEVEQLASEVNELREELSPVPVRLVGRVGIPRDETTQTEQGET